MTTRNASNGWRWAGLIVLLLILLILWQTGHGPSFSGPRAGCCGLPAGQNEPLAAPVAAPVVDFAIRSEEGRVTLTGTVPSETERQRTIKAAIEVFGEGNVVDQLSVREEADLPGWWPSLNNALTWAKNGKGFSLEQSGDEVILTGSSASEADRAEKEAELRAVIGPHLAVANQIRVEQAPVASIPAEVPPCSGEMRVAISFNTGSARLDTAGRKQLENVAQCITVQTEVGGHTDNVGSDVSNNRLSKARADAVVAYIASIDSAKGALLTAVGYGASQPVADNATEEGRSQNRRIEFIAR